ncbi:hypothetical protein [Streptomyces purpurogeneiscleroticus]|uniref:hypothetical protein n=1 Tax=Streptomyces purpurogeneiscleroticus TaxID=68259 RepID=UPI001CC12AAD|nr:hypothetical protein [Streptomyces purpurogeneiscleroticus]MBZ4015212.1 hypothetical protein [Streptomyces purpurogeneiscleroticus]
MTDRRRRAALLLPLPATAPGAAVLLPRERKPSPSSSEGASGDGRGAGAGGQDDRDRDNPFAAPPAGTPDREWRPRHAHSGHPEDSGDSGDSRDGAEGSSGEHDGRHAWGNQWSSKQPGRQGGGFGSRPGRGGPEGPTGPGGPGQTGLRWDPTDPAQRRARYALLSGMWAFFFSLFSLPEIALLLGALALYWGISALRAKPRASKPGQGKTEGAKATAADVGGGRPSHEPETTTAGPPHATAGNTGAPTASGSTRPQTTAALSGLVTAGLALCIVAAGFTLQLVYKDYYTCVNDALTQSARHSCEDLLPEQLRPILSVQE